jgi:hypothetical protein
VFLNRVAAHPVLGKSTELQLFLEATEDTWAVEMARAQVTGGALLAVSIFQVLCCSVCDQITTGLLGFSTAVGTAQ